MLRERDQRKAADEQVLSVYRDRGVVPKLGQTDNYNKTPEDVSAYKLVLPGDLVINKMKAWQGSVAVSRYRGIVSGDYLVCEITADVSRQYLHHLCRSSTMVAEYARRSSGIRPSQWRLYWQDLAEIEVDLPSRTDQEQIARFLDAETVRIDSLIEKKRRMIDVIDERRRAVFDRLTVPASLGGVADAGQSQHWHVTTLKRIATFFSDGDWIESPFITSTGIRLIQTGNIAQGEYREQGYRYISEATFVELNCTEVLPGDVLISRLAGPVGCACRAPNLGVRMVGSVDVVILRPMERVEPDFLVAYLTSSRHLAFSEIVSRGTTMQRLSRGQVGELPVPVPPLQEQRRVVTEVSRATALLKAARGSLKSQVDLLVERRQALITAALTGQVTVPGVAG